MARWLSVCEKDKGRKCISCMTFGLHQKRYLAESNCSTRFCRPLPNRSAKVPFSFKRVQRYYKKTMFPNFSRLFFVWTYNFLLACVFLLLCPYHLFLYGAPVAPVASVLCLMPCAYNPQYGVDYGHTKDCCNGDILCNHRVVIVTLRKVDSRAWSRLLGGGRRLSSVRHRDGQARAL